MAKFSSDVATLFDVFCIAKIDSAVIDPGASPVVTLSNVYPPEFSDEPTLRSIRQFSFPCGVDRYAVIYLRSIHNLVAEKTLKLCSCSPLS